MDYSMPEKKPKGPREPMSFGGMVMAIVLALVIGVPLATLAIWAIIAASIASRFS